MDWERLQEGESLSKTRGKSSSTLQGPGSPTVLAVLLTIASETLQLLQVNVGVIKPRLVFRNVMRSNGERCCLGRMKSSRKLLLRFV